MRAAGALDGEVAFLAGSVTKSLVFSGGADAVAGRPGISAEDLAASPSLSDRVAWEAYMESAAKAVAALAVAVPQAHDVVLSGRGARSTRVRDELASLLKDEETKTAASAVGAKVRAEHGGDRAVDALEALAGKSPSTRGSAIAR